MKQCCICYLFIETWLKEYTTEKLEDRYTSRVRFIMKLVLEHSKIGRRPCDPLICSVISCLLALIKDSDLTVKVMSKFGIADGGGSSADERIEKDVAEGCLGRGLI